MIDIANGIYGDSTPAPSSGSHPYVDPATGRVAPAPGTQPAEGGAGIYGSAAPGGNPLLDGSVHSNLRSTLQDMVDAGQVEQHQALAIGRTLTAEASAIGLTGAELDVALRDINRPLDEPKVEQRVRGAAVADLRHEYGANAERVLAAGVAVLQAKAPNLAAALARSKAGNSVDVVRHVARLGERALRGGTKK